MSFILLMIILSYLAGSIPTSIIAGKILKGIDIREHGSGNAGATNVFRVLGSKAASIVLLIDIFKGVLATVWISKIGLLGADWQVINLQIIAGISAILGHIWTIFAGFKGGKGIATAAGMVMGITPVGVSICLSIFLIVLLSTRYVSLGSLLASVALPVVLLAQKNIFDINIPQQTLIFSIFIPLLVFYTHRSNIQRLLKGEEQKIKLRRS